MKADMDKREPESCPIPQWCDCVDWRRWWDRLKNYGEMNYCGFCGKRLAKVVGGKQDTE